MSNMMPYRFTRNLANRPEYSPFEEFFRPFFGGENLPNALKVDVSDEGDHYLLEADMPGLKKEDVHLDVDDGVLTISAETDEKKREEKSNYVFCERRSTSFRRSFTLNGIDEGAIHAAYEDGVLKVTLPKQAEEPKATARKIDIA